jgi:lambda repressor-like predicted transcriptional regulator
MKSRCYCEKNNMYRYYGGRGIRVCDRWLGENGFVNFLSDIGERPSKKHSIDRYPNRDGNYEPGNVRWATDIEQANNKSNNRWLTVNGEQDTLANWSRRSGTGVSTIKNRLKRGWSETDAVLHPSQKNKDKFTLTLGERTQTLAQWSAETGLTISTIRRRMALQMPVESVLQMGNHSPGKRRKEYTTYTTTKGSP